VTNQRARHVTIQMKPSKDNDADYLASGHLSPYRKSSFQGP
jgi:hypothetical protein